MAEQYSSKSDSSKSDSSKSDSSSSFEDLHRSIMSSDNENQDEDNEKFKAWNVVISTLCIDDLLDLEYRIKNDNEFRKLIIKMRLKTSPTSFRFRCTLCSRILLGCHTNLIMHLKGTCHVLKVNEEVKEYRHPTINPLLIEKNKHISSEDDSDSSDLDCYFIKESKLDQSPRSVGPSNNSSSNSSIFSQKSKLLIENVEGLIGVEYVIKLIRFPNDYLPRYECCLCSLSFDAIGMQCHLKSLLHRTKYLDIHYPKVMKEFEKFRYKASMSSVMAQITEKLACAIECYHGVTAPLECLMENFSEKASSIIAKAKSFRHADECNGPSFIDLIDKETLDLFISKKDTYKIPEPNPRKITFDRLLTEAPIRSEGVLDNEEYQRRVEEFLENVNRGNNCHRSLQRKPTLTSSNRNCSRFKHDLPIPDGDIWKNYCRQFDDAIEKLNKKYENYKKNPESHPNYGDEWKKFWSKRSEELVIESADVFNYNFQPEWIKFFTTRIDELYKETVEHIRIGLKKKFGYDLSYSELNQQRSSEQFKKEHELKQQHHQRDFSKINMGPPQIQRMFYRQQTQQIQQMYQMPNMCPGPSQPSMEPYVEQFQSNNQELVPSRQPMFPSTNYAEQPFFMQPCEANPSEGQQSNEAYENYYPNNEEQENFQIQNCNNENIQSIAISSASPPSLSSSSSLPSLPSLSSLPPSLSSSSSSPPLSSKKKNLRKFSENHFKKGRKTNSLDSDTENITPVSVLRILTVLENHLGSLGPKVNDLLSEALVLEKTNPSNLTQFLTSKNCIILETVREKLKGLVLTKVLRPAENRAAKRSIREIKELLEKYEKERMKLIIKSPTPSPPIISKHDNKKKYIIKKKSNIPKETEKARRGINKRPIITKQSYQPKKKSLSDTLCDFLNRSKSDSNIKGVFVPATASSSENSSSSQSELEKHQQSKKNIISIKNLVSTDILKSILNTVQNNCSRQSLQQQNNIPLLQPHYNQEGFNNNNNNNKQELNQNPSSISSFNIFQRNEQNWKAKLHEFSNNKLIKFGNENEEKEEEDDEVDFGYKK